MPRFVAPAGTPLGIADILGAWKADVLAFGKRKEFLALFAARLGVDYVSGTSSGRAALWLALRALHRLRPDRDVVAIPAYTCFSVAASVVRAGLKLCPMEIDPATLDCDVSGLDACVKDRLLCIVSSHLFGFVNDISRVRAAAEEAGAFVVDNAAQALGATCGGYLAGTGGDFGIYSFGRGKALSAMEGGAVVTRRDELARALQEEERHLSDASLFHGARLLAELLAYSAFLRPRLYWIAESLPFLELGLTKFDPGFPVRALHGLSGKLLERLLDHLDEINQIRRKNAAFVTNALAGCDKISFPQPAPNSQPTMARLPVIACDEITRRRAVTLLRQAGIGASTFYPTAICDIPGIEPSMAVADFHRKKAEHLSRTLFTLPVHPYVERQDMARMVDILGSLQVERGQETVDCQQALAVKRT